MPTKPKTLDKIGIFACSFCGRGSACIVKANDSKICSACLSTAAKQVADGEVTSENTDSLKCDFCFISLAVKEVVASSKARICRECIRQGNEIVQTSQPDCHHLSLITVPVPLAANLLNAYLESKRIECVKEWLFLIRDLEVPEDYFFCPQSIKLLCADALVDDVHNTLRLTVNQHILANLSRALKGRKDDDSLDLLLELLSNDDHTVRYWAGWSLQGGASPRVAAELPRFIRDSKLRSTALTKCAIENKVDGLHDVYEVFLEPANDTDPDWRRSALDYLAAFPREKERDLFRSIIESDGDACERWDAAKGLGNLHDSSSVDLLIDTMKKENYDNHRRAYLEALGKIKGDKAEEIVKSFRNSKDDQVRKLVAELLKAW